MNRDKLRKDFERENDAEPIGKAYEWSHDAPVGSLAYVEHLEDMVMELTPTRVIVIAAMDVNKGIGLDNDLPWHLPNDMKFFKERTRGSTVVMGRKNWESIPAKFRPLPGRKNIVISMNSEYEVPNGVDVFDWNHFRYSVLPTLKGDVYIIGGAQIYEAALEAGVVDEMLLTHVDAIVKADIHFPTKHTLGFTRKEKILTQSPDEKHKYGFETFRYVKSDYEI